MLYLLRLLWRLLFGLPEGPPLYVGRMKSVDFGRDVMDGVGIKLAQRVVLFEDGTRFEFRELPGQPPPPFLPNCWCEVRAKGRGYCFRPQRTVPTEAAHRLSEPQRQAIELLVGVRTAGIVCAAATSFEQALELASQMPEQEAPAPPPPPCASEAPEVVVPPPEVLCGGCAEPPQVSETDGIDAMLDDGWCPAAAEY